MRDLRQLNFIYPAILVLAFSLGCTAATINPPAKPFNEDQHMTTNQLQVLQLLKLFEDNNNLDDLSKASRLVQQMQIEEPASSQEKKAFNHEKTQLHLMLLNKIDSKLIPDFDFNDVPMLSVSPPPESGLPSGVDPSSITDPSMRLKYQKSVLENQEKVTRYSFQKKLLKINKKVTEQTENYLKAEILKKEQDLLTLNKLIDSIVSNDKRKIMLKQYILKFQAP